MKCAEYTFCQLSELEVVNVTDGQKLGRINDIAFTESGKITGFIVPGEKQFLKNITGKQSIFIPWQCVLKFGNDVILVDLNNGANQHLGLNP